MEWPKDEAEPTKYWLSTLPPETKLKDLVKIAKHRWLIERDYEELKQELGLGHFEGRGWWVFHHHATLCIAAYGFLVAERSRFPPPPAPANWNYPRLNCRRTSARVAAPLSCGRHNPHSVAALRRTIAGFLIRQLPCCPFCDVKRL